MPSTGTDTGGGKAKSSKQKPEKKAKPIKGEQHPADKLKIVIRRLPPNIPEEIFWQTVQPWVSEETTTWKIFYPGKIRKKYNKENVPSRAYIAFKNVEQVSIFSQAYDGHRFQDKSGNESIAVVEFAPFQKIPPERKKVDPRAGTIEGDDDYKSFVASLSAPKTKPSDSETIETLIAATRPPPEPESTPLLEALRADKQAQRDRETILKAHAHYQRADVESPAQSSRRRVGKAVPVVPAAPTVPTAPPPAEKEENAGTTSGSKRRRGRKSDTKEKGKEREPAPPPPTKGGTKGGQKPPPVAKPKEVPKEKEVVKDRPTRVAQSAVGSRSLQLALSGLGIKKSIDKGPKPASASDAQSNSTTAIPTVAVAAAPDSVAKEKVENKPENVAQSPGKRGGRRRANSAKSTNQPQTQPQLQKAPAAPTILPRPTGATTRPAESPVQGGADGKATSSKSESGGRGGRRRGRGRGAGGGNATRGGTPSTGTTPVNGNATAAPI